MAACCQLQFLRPQAHTRVGLPPTHESGGDFTVKRATYSPAGLVLTDLVLEIFRFNGRVIAAGDRLTAPMGLTSARWQVLGALSEGPAPTAHIARRMGLRRQSVQRLVDILLEEGLVIQEENPHHRRAHLLRLSETGEKQLERITEAWTKTANSMAEGLTEKELARALALLQTLTERIPDSQD